MKGQMNERHQNICIYGGIFGILLSATCLIQLMAYTNSHWIAYTLFSIYAFILFVFVQLSLQRSYAPVLTIIASATSMIAVLYVMIAGFYSLVLILMFLYCLIFTIVIYMENIPAGLKAKARLKKEEDLAWRDKL